MPSAVCEYAVIALLNYAIYGFVVETFTQHQIVHLLPLYNDLKIDNVRFETRKSGHIDGDSRISFIPNV